MSGATMTETILTRPARKPEITFGGDFQWSAENIETLRRLWGQDCTPVAIAAHFGNRVTNSQVSSKAHKLGLPPRPHLAGDNPRRHAVTRFSGLGNAAPIEGAPALAELKPHQCRFPITGNNTHDHRFCGAPTQDHKSFCELHHSLAYIRRKVLAGAGMSA